MRIVYPQPAYFETLRSMIYRIKKRYPFVSCRVCGRSLAGRAIFVLSAGPVKNSAMFVAGVHGQEWITSLILLHYFENVCKNASLHSDFHGIDLCNINNGISIVPCLNPDSVQINLCGSDGACCFKRTVDSISGGNLSDWNANARGVDINHNFDAGWEILRKLEEEAGITGPSPRRYGGPYPESEPETIAITNLIRRCTPCQVVALHSQGEEIYWRYGENTPARSEVLAKLFAQSSGYELKDTEGLASHGGLKDWFIDKFSKPGFTFEIGKGKNPLPLDDFDSIYNKIEEMLVLASVCSQ